MPKRLQVVRRKLLEQLAAECTPEPASRPQQNVRPQSATPPPKSSANGQGKIPNGQRHDSLVSYAGKLLKLKVGVGYEYAAFETDLLQFNSEMFQEPYSEQEVQRQARDLYQRYRTPATSSSSAPGATSRAENAEDHLDDAKAKIASLKQDPHNTSLLKEALDAVAAITDKLQREVMEAELAATVRGVISRATIAQEISARLARWKARADELKREQEKRDLLARPVNVKQVVDELEQFFFERLFLPVGSALILAYFTLNTWTFDLFDALAFLLLESAVSNCGKTTVFRILEYLCPNAHRLTAPTEATLFRLLGSSDSGGRKPILLIDEAKILESKSDRADLLRAILDEAYKKGGKVPRCEGENNEIRWFDVYAPICLAEIGGLSGALLDRCIVVHMERIPHGLKLRSTRIRALKRDSAPLVERLKAYELQSRAELQRLYDAEPDEGYWPQLETREAELYDPLLIHAKLIGPDAEQKLLAAVEKFTQAKAKIQAEDSRTARAIDLLHALKDLTGS